LSGVRTTCAYCGVGCGVVATPTGGRSTLINGDPDHPANRGRLCSKGTYLGETIGLEGRLLAPMIGGEQSGWDAALDLVAERSRDAIEHHGPDSVAFYVSGQLLTEDYFAANKLMKGFIGSANIDTNSRLCMAGAVAAHNRAFGEDLVPGCYADIDEADLIILVGSNTAWCHPIVWQRIEAARLARGTRVVVLDPRRTETAEGADLRLKLRSGTDIALFKGIEAYLLQQGAINPREVEARVAVPADYWDSFADYGIDAVAATCDVPASDLRTLYDLFAARPRTVTLFSVNQSTHGTDKASAIINLHLVTDRIGKPGAAPFSITGQPNAMGGREVGGLASSLAAHMDFAPENVDRVGRFWRAPAIARQPGLKAVDLFRAVGEGKIKALWVMATNPAVSMPDAARVREALGACPFVVVSDVIADTDTSRFAHVRLPALGWGEKDGTVTNSERSISRQRAFLAPPGEARPDWWIIAQVARRMGFGDAFDWDGPAAVFREHCRLTAFENEGERRLDLKRWSGLSDADYTSLAPSQWGGERIAFAPGKARLFTVGQPAVEASPMLLNSGRYRDQWHGMTRTGLSPRLSQHRREPLVEVHPADALAAGLASGDLARVATTQGDSIFRVAVTDAQRPGEIFVPIHWTDRVSSGGRAGLLPGSAADPESGQPGFKSTPAAIAKVSPDWHAFLLLRQPPARDPECLWWTKIRVSGGTLFEIAGRTGEDVHLDEYLGAGELLEVSDPARGVRRLVVTQQSRLMSALFVARDARLPPRDWLIEQLASADPGPVLAFLTARTPGRSRPAEAAVCVCHGVGKSAIVKAIVKHGAASVAEIGAATCAGTNCGSCRPELARILAQQEQSLAA